MTLGEDRVRVSFNPSSDTVVDEIKRATAKLIDAMELLKRNADAERVRLIALAQTHYEDAAMWAVKAYTYEAPEEDAEEKE